MKFYQIILSLLVLQSVACLQAIPIQPVEVKGTAMLPALEEGDKIIIDRAFDKLERGDIVIFYFPDDQRMSYIKRIVGLPNEEVDIQEGKVLINGKLLDEPYVDTKFDLSMRSLRKIKVPEDSYFVMGDNRDNSSDSRIWGPLHRKFIYGKYVKKYFEAKLVAQIARDAIQN